MALTVAVATVLLLVAGPSCKDDPPEADAAVDAAVTDLPPHNWKPHDLGNLLVLDDAGVQANLFDIWGVDASAIWAVGDGGKVLFYDGKNWATQETPVTQRLSAVWGTAATNVWACGFDGTVIHYNGAIWEDRSPPEGLFLTVDGGPGVFDSGEPRPIERRNMWGIWVGGSGTNQSLYTVGDQGMILNLYQNAWARVDADVQEKLYGVWGRNPNSVVIVGDFGTILTGSATAGFTKRDSSVDKALRGVWGRGSQVFAVGLAGTILRSTDGGASWEIVGRPEEGEPPPQFFREIWGPSNENAYYLVGWDGVLMRMTRLHNPKFEFFPGITPNRLEGIWGTLVDGPLDGGPDGADGGTDAIPQVPKIWVVGTSGTMITGP